MSQMRLREAETLAQCHSAGGAKGSCPARPPEGVPSLARAQAALPIRKRLQASSAMLNFLVATLN